MKKILTVVLCAAQAVCNTLNAQETMKENEAFAAADMSAFKSHNSNPWGLVYADAVAREEPLTDHAGRPPAPQRSISGRVLTEETR